MNDLTFDDLCIGMEESFSVRLTHNMMTGFAAISGDVNPLHVDEDFAHKAGYPSCVAYGMLTSSLYSQLVGVWLPGRSCLLQSIQVKFLAPSFVGDELRVSGKVDELHDTVRMARIAAEIRNQNGRRISKAKIQVGFVRTPQEVAAP